MKNQTLYKYILFIIGAFFLGAGIALSDIAHLGVDPMSVMILGASYHLPITFGMTNFALSVLQILISYFLDKKNITLATILAMLFTSFGIDAVGAFQIQTPEAPWNFLVLILGFLVYCISVAVCQFPHCGYNSYDCVVFGIMKHTGKPYHTIRWFVDITYLLIGWLLGGTVGIGTVIVMLFAGYIIEYMLKFLNKVLPHAE